MRPLMDTEKRRPCFLNIAWWKRKLASQRGVISIFLCGVLLLMSLSSAILMDYARVETAKADTRSALRMLSHAALSSFDKKAAREFGVFAVKDEKSLSERANALLKARYSKEENFQSIRSEALTLTVTPTDLARLSRPEEMDRQIHQFMEWQIPSKVLGKAMEQLELFQNMAPSIAVFKAKVDYEKQLQGVQDALNGWSGSMESMAKLSPPEGARMPALPASFSSGDKTHQEQIFTGLPASKPLVNELQQKSERLDTLLLKHLEKALAKAETVPADPRNWGNLLTLSDRNALKSAFVSLVGQARTTSDWFGKVADLNGKAKTEMGKTTQKIDGLEASKKNWEGTLGSVGAGTFSQNLWGDYLATTSARDTKALADFQKEWDTMGKQAGALADAWKSMQWNGKPLLEINFDEWLKVKLASIRKLPQNRFQLPSSSIQTASVAGWDDGKAFSEKALQTQSNLAAQAARDRSGIFEFLRAWNTKRKAIANARQAKRLGLPTLSGGITDHLSSDVLARYEADAAATPAGARSAFSGGNEVQMLDHGLLKLEKLTTELQATAPADLAAMVCDLTYWSCMFSHRTSPLQEKEKGKPLLSLTGYPLSERPIFGGEIEYLLQGRPTWLECIKQTEYRVAAMRLFCNMLYAFTSSELYAETTQLALALAGWTGFAVPLVQSALLMVLAVGETSLDMDALTAGERVSVMKSPETWQFSLSGVKEMAKKAVRDVFDTVEIEAIAGVEAGADMAKETAKRISSSLQEKVQDALRRPLLSVMEKMLLQTENLTAEQRKAKLTDMLQALASHGQNGSMGAAVSGAFQSLSGQTDMLSDILDKAFAEKKKAGEVTDAVIRSLQARTEVMVKGACEKLAGMAEQQVEHLSDKLHAIASENGGDKDEKMQQALAVFKEDTGMGDGAAMSSNAGLTMGYGDYMVFLLLITDSTRAGHTALLSRTARLIQAETGETDFTVAPTSLDWTMGSTLSVLFLPQFSATTLTHGEAGVPISASWKEGYGMAQKTEVIP